MLYIKIRYWVRNTKILSYFRLPARVIFCGVTGSVVFAIPIDTNLLKEEYFARR
jgi:hypothetical protein